jgi:hypothetical protein
MSLVAARRCCLQCFRTRVLSASGSASSRGFSGNRRTGHDVIEPALAGQPRRAQAHPWCFAVMRLLWSRLPRQSWVSQGGRCACGPGNTAAGGRDGARAEGARLRSGPWPLPRLTMRTLRSIIGSELVGQIIISRALKRPVRILRRVWRGAGCWCVQSGLGLDELGGLFPASFR